MSVENVPTCDCEQTKKVKINNKKVRLAKLDDEGLCYFCGHYPVYKVVKNVKIIKNRYTNPALQGDWIYE